MEREVIFFNWIKPGSRVLDIGCGNSRLLLELKQKKNCIVEGIDISPLVIDKLSAEGVPAFVADVTSDSFALDKQYDVIIMSELLEHILEPESLVRTVSRNTRELIMSVPNSAFYRYRIHLMFSGRFFTQWVHHPAEHVRYWSHTDFLDWIDALDLTLITSKASNGFTLKDMWPNMFGHQMAYHVATRHQ